MWERRRYIKNRSLLYRLNERDEIRPLTRSTPFVSLFASRKRFGQNSDSARTNISGRRKRKNFLTIIRKSNGTKNISSTPFSFSFAIRKPVCVRHEKWTIHSGYFFLISMIKFCRERTSPTETAWIQIDLFWRGFFFRENPHLWRKWSFSCLKNRDLKK